MQTIVPQRPTGSFRRLTGCCRRAPEPGGTVTGGTPAQFGTIIADATEKWAKVIKFAGIKAE